MNKTNEDKVKRIIKTKVVSAADINSLTTALLPELLKERDAARNEAAAYKKFSEDKTRRMREVRWQIEKLYINTPIFGVRSPTLLDWSTDLLCAE